ncbi:CBS domain-containing protein [Streptomyces ureilyticus]|uniref:CBS domain-containing protein n=1 Tax=Streptomyces ureilyticus TaxID=1775131 RepID=A0ABX0DM76_9ACTN|nr:CBS domain-containing protein [Streptomyces ureilyticus]NGO42888.1 CBS domain-containing protein [Streptomyces ureilyticus]
MRAYDLADPYPSVSTDDDAVATARLFVERRLPALLVVDADQRPYAVVPGSQLLRVALPDFALEEPALAVSLREADIESLPEKLRGLTVAQWIPRHGAVPAVVGPDAGAAEIAVLMARTHTPLVAVVEADGERTRTVGAITAARLMDYFLTQG